MIVSHLLLILYKKIQFYIFMFEAWNVAKGRKVQGGRILSQGTVYFSVKLNSSYLASYSSQIKSSQFLLCLLLQIGEKAQHTQTAVWP